MDDLQKLFTENLKPRQKQYEALRMLVIESKSYQEVAEHFGYTIQTVRNLKTKALAGQIEFFECVPLILQKLKINRM